jgi:hypothetical protein
MSEKLEGRDRGLRTFILFLFVAGWIVTIVVVALLMRTWIPEVDVMAELAAIEEAETDQAEPDRLPSTLRPLPGPLPELSVSGAIYVPIFESLYVGGKRRLNNLSATLSLRNTSSNQPHIISAVRYFDASGAEIAAVLDAPRVLAPLSVAELYIDQGAYPGGPVTAAIVDWGAEGLASPPLIKAVIVGSYGAKNISFVSGGEAIE